MHLEKTACYVCFKHGHKPSKRGIIKLSESSLSLEKEGAANKGMGLGVEEGEEHGQKDENPNDYAARANDTTRLCVLLMLSRLRRD